MEYQHVQYLYRVHALTTGVTTTAGILGFHMYNALRKYKGT